MGKSRIAVRFTMVSEVDWAGSISDADTSISDVVSSICRVTFARTVVPTLTRTPTTEEFANPSVPARTVYVPGSRLEARYSPLLLECNVRATPVASLTTVICASAIDAPSASRTLPMIRPLWASVWAKTELVQASRRRTGRAGHNDLSDRRA